MELKKVEDVIREAALACANAADHSVIDDEVVEWMGLYEDLCALMGRAIKIEERFQKEMVKV